MLSKKRTGMVILLCWICAAAAGAQETVKVFLQGAGYQFGSAEEPTSREEAASAATPVLKEKLPYWFWAESKLSFLVMLKIEKPLEQSHIFLSIYYKGERLNGTNGKDSWSDELIKEDTEVNGKVSLAIIPRGKGKWEGPIRYSLSRLVTHNQESIESALKPIPIGGREAVLGLPPQIPARSSVPYPITLNFHWAKDSPRGHIFLLDVDTSSGPKALEMVGIGTLQCSGAVSPDCVKVRAEKFNSILTFDLHEYKDLIEIPSLWERVKPGNFYWCRRSEGGPLAP